jgi:CheY-like chemotaxis protein
MLAELLQRAGARAYSGSSAAEGLQLVKQYLPDVLISDIGMPGADGFDLIRAVRALPQDAGGNVAAAALTGYTTDEDRVRAEVAGFQLHLRKPVERDELIAAVQTLAGLKKTAAS